MWQNSNYTRGNILREERREQAGLLFPDGSFQSLTINNNGPCGGTVSDPGFVPPGTIFVHTHPWGNGETSICEGSEGQTYGNRPSMADVLFMRAHGIQLGLIIDADGISVYTDEFDPNDPNAGEWKHKDGEEGKCGIDRG